MDGEGVQEQELVLLSRRMSDPPSTQVWGPASHQSALRIFSFFVDERWEREEWVMGKFEDELDGYQAYLAIQTLPIRPYAQQRPTRAR